MHGCMGKEGAYRETYGQCGNVSVAQIVLKMTGCSLCINQIPEKTKEVIVNSLHAQICVGSINRTKKNKWSTCCYENV